MGVVIFALTDDPPEIWVLDERDSRSAYDAAKSRARRRGIIDGGVPIPECLATLRADPGDAAVNRIRRRLGKWAIVGARFHDTPASRAAVAALQYQDLKVRQMI